MISPPRLRIQRTSRGLRWSAWEGAGIEPDLDCVQAYHAEPLDAYLASFYRLAEGSFWQRPPEEHLKQAVEQLGKRLEALIPEEIQAWLLARHHLVLEASDASIPWELAYLEGKSLWKRLNLRRCPFPTEEQTLTLKAPLRCLLVADSDGTLSFCNERALQWQKRLKDKVEIDLITGSETGLEPLARRFLENEYQAFVWNSSHLSYDSPPRSHLWLHDKAVNTENWRRAVKNRLPPVVVLNWHSVPDVHEDRLRCQQIDDWAQLLQEMGARAVLASAWDHEELDLFWLDTFDDFSQGASLFTSLRRVRLKNESKSWSQSILLYGNQDVGLGPHRPESEEAR